jgi:hypothetical protein
MRWIMKLMTRTNRGLGAMIIDKTSIIIKNDTTTMISNLASRKEVQVKLRHMRNRRRVKMGSAKSAMTNNRNKSTINNLNRHRSRKRTHRTMMSKEDPESRIQGG